MKEKELFGQRLKDLADQSFKNNKFTYTSFLSEGELSDYYLLEKELKFASPSVWGGRENADRVMVRFGDADAFGFEEGFPIVMLEISPLNVKFSDDFTHRDFLGALMNLGIERNTLGDILVNSKKGFIFCKESVSEYIKENLTKVKHTSVLVKETNELDEEFKPVFDEKIVQVASERIDAVISKVYNLSRNSSNELFRTGKVFVNSRECTSNSYELKTGDVISVRGFGKMIFEGSVGLSKKGKSNVKVSVYGTRK